MKNKNAEDFQKELVHRAGFEAPNPIQEKYWDNAENYNILLAPTGAGKTFAFLVQALQENQFPILIVSPTRELALQIAEVTKKITENHSIVTCYGGHSVENEVLQLNNQPDFVIGTPGRIADHLERGNFSLKTFRQLIIDEFDKLFELGFIAQIRSFIQQADWQTIQLSSATTLTKKQALPDFPWKTINLLTEQKSKAIAYELVIDEAEKVEQLIDFVKAHLDLSMLIFCAHRDACDRIFDHLQKNRIPAAIYHGGMKQYERELTFVKMNHGSSRILVATDLAARGLDLPEVDLVIHYQQALNEETEIHRNGRTARNGAKGSLLYLVTKHDEQFQPISAFPKRNKTNRKEFVTLHINGGRKQKLRKVDFIGFLCKEKNVPSEAIVGINIFDNHTYVTLEKTIFSSILINCNKVKIKKLSLIIRPTY